MGHLLFKNTNWPGTQKNESDCKLANVFGKELRNEELLEILPGFFTEPKAHQMELTDKVDAFIPFCSFSSDQLEECKSFKIMPFKIHLFSEFCRSQKPACQIEFWRLNSNFSNKMR